MNDEVIMSAHCQDADYFLVWPASKSTPIRVDANHYELFNNRCVVFNNKSILGQRDAFGSSIYRVVFVTMFNSSDWATFEVVRKTNDG
jgi:hypothetical protein